MGPRPSVAVDGYTGDQLGCGRAPIVARWLPGRGDRSQSQRDRPGLAGRFCGLLWNRVPQSATRVWLLWSLSGASCPSTRRRFAFRRRRSACRTVTVPRTVPDGGSGIAESLDGSGADPALGARSAPTPWSYSSRGDGRSPSPRVRLRPRSSSPATRPVAEGTGDRPAAPAPSAEHASRPAPVAPARTQEATTGRTAVVDAAFHPVPRPVGLVAVTSLLARMVVETGERPFV